MDPQTIIEWAHPYAQAWGLPYMAIHIMTIIRSLLLWYAIQLLSHMVSPKLFPQSFARMSRRTRISWDLHMVSFVHSIIVAPMALYFWLQIDESTDRLWGYDYTLGQVYALSLGYFAWDVMMSLRYEGFAFVLHGALGLIAALLVYKPLLMFDGLSVLIWELSTPFLNIHWALDKLGRTGSRLQFINAVFLVITYIGVRLLLGVYASYRLIELLWASGYSAQPVPISLRMVYTLGLPALNFLNYMWFFKMLRAIRKRFPAEATKTKEM